MIFGERKPLGGFLFIFLIIIILIQESRVNWYKRKFENERPVMVENKNDLDLSEELFFTTTTAVAETTTQKGKDENWTNEKSCVISESVDWSTKIEAKYQLDKSKFLTVVTLAGPNNQMRGFREMIFMAVKLNRTIIPAPFFKHSKTDPTAEEETDVVPEYLRLDLNSLRNLVTTVSSSTAKEHCGDNFGAFFKTRPMCSTVNNIRLEGVCSYLNMSCQINGEFISSNCPNYNIPIYPLVDQIYDHDLEDDTGRGFDFGRRDDLIKINHYFDSDEKCAILGFPYMSVSFHLAETNRISIEDKQLMIDIVQMTQRPLFVRTAVTKFLDQIETPFISMHWRYNQNDWLHGGCSKRTDTDRKDKEQFICDRVRLMNNPTIMAVQLQKYLNNTKSVKSMYIASPPSEIPLLINVRKELKILNPDFTIYLNVELLEFILEYFEENGCINLEEDKYEILSLADMEVCFRSKSFLSSIGSSWSGNLNMERRLSDRSSRDKSNTILMPNPADYPGQ